MRHCPDFLVKPMRKSIYSEEYRELVGWRRKKRGEAGLASRAVADKLEVYPSIVGNIETCGRRLDVAEYLQFCQAISANPVEGIGLMAQAAQPATDGMGRPPDSSSERYKPGSGRRKPCSKGK